MTNRRHVSFLVLNTIYTFLQEWLIPIIFFVMCCKPKTNVPCIETEQLNWVVCL